MNQLDQLKRLTKVVADSGEFESIAKYHPLDATTNPTLVFTAIQQAPYQPLLKDALNFAKTQGKDLDKREQQLLAFDRLLINFGVEILKLIPGRVSTEVDARLSFNTQGSIKKARELIHLYEVAGIDKKRVLIKLASTWEGIQAATVLERRDPLQHDLDVLGRSGGCLRRSESDLDLAIRRPHPRLVQKG